MIAGISHVTLLVPPGTIPQAQAFYGRTLGFTAVPVPAPLRDRLAWFDITPRGQQVHIAVGEGEGEPRSSRHPCFKVESPGALAELRRRVWDHFARGGGGAPSEADEPGKEISGPAGAGFPERFFARDYGGNRLEFSL